MFVVIFIVQHIKYKVTLNLIEPLNMKINPAISKFIKKNDLPDSFIFYAQQWFIPLAKTILAHQKRANKPFFVGINGAQGSGKSTLTEFLSEFISAQYNLNVVNLSLDDFYLSQQQRAKLATDIQPLLKTRGVPGTHNITLLESTLTQLSNAKLPLSLPRFNKATDNPFAKSGWTEQTQQADIILFEGWCWGVTAQSDITNPCNELEHQEDPNGVWRQYVNHQLQTLYQPLYEKMDYWLMLKAPSFNCIYKWRTEQEHKLIKQQQASSATMNDTEIARFIQHFQRLTEHALMTLPANCDLIFELDHCRQILSVSGQDSDSFHQEVSNANQ